MPERILLSRSAGWRLPPNAVMVSRPSRWGNPYRVDVFGRELAVDLFRNSMEGGWSPLLVAHLSDATAAEAYRIHTEMRSRVRHHDVRELRGKDLACWCKAGDACHADVLIELANRPL